jgi:hypothetical protein
VEFNINGILDNAVHISGFLGEDGRIVELNAVSLVDTVFSYGYNPTLLSPFFPLITPLHPQF